MSFHVLFSLDLPSVQGMQMIRSEPTIKSVNPQPKHVFVDDLCRSVVQFEPSPVKKLLWDLANIKRKRAFEFVAGIDGDSGKLPVCMTLSDDHVYDLVKLSIRKRRKFNAVAKTTQSQESAIVDQACLEPTHTPEPLLALEWHTGQPEEWPAEFQADESDEVDDKWFTRPAISAISDICERTSQLTTQLRHQVPRAAMFLWAQILQLLSCSKNLLSVENSEDQGRRSALFREPPRSCYLSVCCKDFSEERSRALAEKKTKRQDSKKNLRRAHGALTQKYHDSTNRKRAMDSKRFHRGCGRKGC